MNKMSLLPDLEHSGETLLERLLVEQRTLTAVARFVQKHAGIDFPLQAKFYRDLIPLSKPEPGQQYAFEVNLDTCSGCKACVSACHSLNGLEENETWRDVGLILGEEKGVAYQQIVTTACHHCQEPGCLQGCPVVAYEKDLDTGIVRHLDDQCIGCQYCTMKCPYDVPKYSERLGIVRKCDMCHGRLAVGEAPACVQACPHEAIKITLVEVEQIRRETKPGSILLPGAYDSSYTLPTTRYLTQKSIAQESVPASQNKLRLEPAHFPLILMLVATQMVAGIFLTLSLMNLVFPDILKSFAFPISLVGFLLLNAGLGCATLHLGRPLGAWRFFLGLRTSWMSREILAFGIFTGAAFMTTASSFFGPDSLLTQMTLMSTALIGVAAVFTSGMIYINTQRKFWKGSLTFPKFFGAMVILGLLANGTFVAGLNHGEGKLCVTIVTVGALILFSVLMLWERMSLAWAMRNKENPTHISARIIEELLPRVSLAKSLSFGFSAFGLCLALVAPALGATPVLLGLATLSAGIYFLLERYQYFAAVVAYRMPGGF